MKSGGILWLAFTLRIITLPANEAIQNGDVTLGGDNATAGRVELYNNGQWGTICDDNWDIDDARVVCHQPGFRDAISAHGNALFGAGSGPIHISKVNCLGYESSLIECCFSLSENCDHGDDAGVTCLPFDHGFVRLVSGNDTKGRVEIFINGQWGTICDDTWDILDATVVCRQLGFEGAIAAPPQAAFGEGIGPILLDTVECLGNELTILDCKYKQKSNCQHSEDAGVECINADFDEGSVRLAGGNQLAGRVEIYKDNQWGTVCDDDWDELDATVVCRQLGFRDAISAPREAEFGEGVGPIHLDSVQCNGGEISLLDCEYKRDADCSHKEDASVTCRDVRSGKNEENPMRFSNTFLWLFANALTLLPSSVAIKNGDLRLANGTATEGRVELYNNGQWGTVCDDNWDVDDARVVCRQLGFRDAITAHGNALFDEGEGPIHINNVNCEGTESFLIECYSSLTDSCGHQNDASVKCLPYDEGFVRLVGGNLTDGRVEIFFKDRWGTICDDTWDISEATVVCRQLGFTGASFALRMAAFGEGEGPIHLDTMDCLGKELTLLDCEYKQKTNCMHNEDAGVECFNFTGDEGSVRLAGGYDLAGRVEIYINNQWGTVCDDDWDVSDANIVCRQLGFPGAISAPRKAAFGEGVGPIHLDSVVCTGDENSLLECEYKLESDCTHKEDASVTCRDANNGSAGWIIVAVLALLIIVVTTAGISSRVFLGAFMNLLLNRIRNLREDIPNNNDVSISSQSPTIPKRVSLTNVQDVDPESAVSERNQDDLTMSQRPNTNSILYSTIPAELLHSAEHDKDESYEDMAKGGKVEENDYDDKIY